MVRRVPAGIPLPRASGAQLSRDVDDSMTRAHDVGALRLLTKDGDVFGASTTRRTYLLSVRAAAFVHGYDDLYDGHLQVRASTTVAVPRDGSQGCPVGSLGLREFGSRERT